MAQSNVDGYVHGSAPAGAELKLQGIDTPLTRTMRASDGGVFRFSTVPPGSYKLTYVNAAGQTVTHDVEVGLGQGVTVKFVEDAQTTQLDEIVVTGAQVSPVDLAQTELLSVISVEKISSMPVARDVQAVALLAAGTIEGDNRFASSSGRPLISFGGASPGENTFYINGLNVTDFRNFLGGANVPFQFYREFQVRTGGYSAEFGRSLGGVVNAVSKRGTDAWLFGANAYFEPESLYARSPSVTYEVDTDDDGVPDRRVYRIDNRADERSQWQANFEAGGPLIREHLYGYALVNLRNIETGDAVGATSYSNSKDSDPFYAIKLDWQIADGHALEYTGFSDSTEQDTAGYTYNALESTRRGEQKSRGSREDGGTVNILRYVGALNDDISLSALYGQIRRTAESRNSDARTGSPCTVVVDLRGGGANPLSCWDAAGNGQLESNKDTRDALRTDVSWFLGDHVLKFGFDYERNVTESAVEYEGGVAYRYQDSEPGTQINGGTVPPGVDQIVRERHYNVGGEYKEELTAFYIEDNWQITDRLLVSAGLRNETLKNFNRDDQEFLGFDAQLTPRLGATYDLFGDGATKLFANLGRYTMPIAVNTNIRFAGGETFTEQYYELQSVDPDSGLPTKGAPIGGEQVYADGSVPDPKSRIDANIKPMYQDEIIVGLESAVTDQTTLGAKFVHRNLVRAVEDSATVVDGNFYYYLFNPGDSVTLYQDPDGDGTPEKVVISAEDTGVPRATRKYYALELTADHQFSREWALTGSYTWSHSYGNFEGVFQSDVGQDDAGVTIAFDTPGLTDYSSGDLPNDRRHKFKLFGTYRPVESITLGANLSVFSGRPRSRLGDCPADREGYDGFCFYAGDDQPSPRGTVGRTAWITNLDLGARYRPPSIDGLEVGLDIFNVIDGERETRVFEISESAGSQLADYGRPASFQSPRHVRFNIAYRFGL